MKKQKLFLVLIILFIIYISSGVYAADETISSGGTYNISSYSSGSTIFINTTDPIILTGTNNVQIDIIVEGTNITFNSVSITSTIGCAVSFIGSNNMLTIEGDNSIISSTNNPGIKVEATTVLTINGNGSLNVNGGDNGAGIGSSGSGLPGTIPDLGTININGSTITANGGNGGAGIGAGSRSNNGTINISGGTINATGGNSGAGIGSGYVNTGITINIFGGDITALGGDLASGIGNGYRANGEGSTINISGGIISSTGGAQGAGIGKGSSDYGTDNSVTISGGEITATGGDYGAGIGGAYCEDGISLTIKEDAKVHAIGNMGYDIGRGYKGSDDGSFNLSGNAKVIIPNNKVTVPTFTGAPTHILHSNIDYEGSSVYAYLPVTYSANIRFDVGTNGNTTDNITFTVSAGGKVSSVPNVTANTGYTFAGWAAVDGKNSVDYTSAEILNLPIYFDTVFYGVYKNNTGYEVSYSNSDSTKGTLSHTTSETVLYNQRPVNMPTCTGEVGYIFDAWYTDSGLNNIFDSSSVITETTVLYAKWKYAPLAGSATIVGEARVGETLTVDRSKITNNTSSLFLGWYRGTTRIAFREDSYTIKESDVGAQIYCYVYSETQTGSIRTPNTETIITNNNPPICDNVIENQEFNIGKSVSYTFPLNTFSDSDGDTLTYTVNKTPSGISFDSSTRTFSGVPDTLGITDITVTASDNKGGMVSDTFRITVINPDFVGSVTVTGDLVYGSNLTSITSGTNETGTLIYQWQADDVDIAGATSSTYILTENEIGKVITCEVRDSGVGAKIGFIESIPTSTIDKATLTIPNAPTLQSKTYNSVTLVNIVGNEYSIDNGITWQDSNVISGLTENTTYNFTQRIKETYVNYASDISIPLTVTTLSKPISSGGSSSIPENTPTKDLENKIRNAKENEKGVKEVTFEIETDENGISKIELPDNFIGEKVEITLKSDNVNITLNGEMFTGKEKSVELIIEPSNKVPLGSEYKDAIVYDISLKIDGEKRDFSSDKDIKIEFSIDKNNKDNHKYVAVYIDEEGIIKILKTSFYNGNMLLFTTKHLSNYGVIYVDKTFEDITNHWGKEAVEAFAARGIIKGTSETTFAPDKTITKAEFVTLIIRYFDLMSNETTSYADVKNEMYYSIPIAIAKEFSILPPTEGDIFNPNEIITREDMMYILHKALVVTGQAGNLKDEGNKLDVFIDKDSLSDYATKGAEYLVSRDIIHGYDGRINPKDASTRAEVAQMLYNILIKLNK